MITITINGDSKEIEEGTTLKQCLDAIEGLPTEYVTVVSHRAYPYDERNECILKEGDYVVVVTTRSFHDRDRDRDRDR